jgi:hypothetical protein
MATLQIQRAHGYTASVREIDVTIDGHPNTGLEPHIAVVVDVPPGNHVVQASLD